MTLITMVKFHKLSKGQGNNREKVLLVKIVCCLQVFKKDYEVANTDYLCVKLNHKSKQIENLLVFCTTI